MKVKRGLRSRREGVEERGLVWLASLWKRRDVHVSAAEKVKLIEQGGRKGRNQDLANGRKTRVGSVGGGMGAMACTWQHGTVRSQH